MPDFTNCKRLLGNAYAGANGKKIGIEYQGEQYMLKFPPSGMTKRTELSYTHSCLSEHIASSIFNMRNISWAKFSSLADPSDEFIVANTHWSYRTEHANGNTFLAGASQPIAANELRDQCRMETYGMLESIRQKHSETPTFLLGDFNTSLSFFAQSGWTPPYFHIISDEAMHAGTALAVVPDSGHFDHLFGTGNYTISRYEYVKNVNFMELLTDHPFAYADLIF